MQIPKNQVLGLLKDRGDHDDADRADKELPDAVDTDRDAGVLAKFGLQPKDLIAKFAGGKIPGL